MNRFIEDIDNVLLTTTDIKQVYIDDYTLKISLKDQHFIARAIIWVGKNEEERDKAKKVVVDFLTSTVLEEPERVLTQKILKERIEGVSKSQVKRLEIQKSEIGRN